MNINKSFLLQLIFLNIYNFDAPMLGECFPAASFNKNNMDNFIDHTIQDSTSAESYKTKNFTNRLLPWIYVFSSLTHEHSITNGKPIEDSNIIKRLKRSANSTAEELHSIRSPYNIISPEMLEQHSEQSSVLKSDTLEKFGQVNEHLPGLEHHVALNEERLSGEYQEKPPSEIEQDTSFFQSMQEEEVNHGTPQYMLELFKTFKNNPFTQPASNIVRSFFNQATMTDRRSYNDAYQRCKEEKSFDKCPRVHHLIFDVTSVPSHERVTMAELRLYKIVEKDRRKYSGIDRKVEVVEIMPSGDNSDMSKNISTKHRKLLDSKRIIGRSSGWETFDITQAVHKRTKSKQKDLYELEIFIENISNQTDEVDVDFEEASKSVNEPLLVVYSDDISRHHKLEHQEELEELLLHNRGDIAEGVSLKPSSDFLFNVDSTYQEEYSNQDILQRKKREQTLTEVSSKRTKRSAHHAPCHLESMYVNFRKIGYSWIINPEGYEAGHCVGICDLPFHGINVSPHAVMQNLMHNRGDLEFKRPCCVPTKLGPISMLYFERNALTYKYKYEGMRVLECGCR